jgi:hypothetical protein
MFRSTLRSARHTPFCRELVRQVARLTAGDDPTAPCRSLWKTMTMRVSFSGSSLFQFEIHLYIYSFVIFVIYIKKLIIDIYSDIKKNTPDHDKSRAFFAHFFVINDKDFCHFHVFNGMDAFFSYRGERATAKKLPLFIILKYFIDE